MKTNDEILARYLSDDSVDFFSAQRLALLCMLPFDMAKTYLEASYVTASEDGTLPEEEKWVENFDIKKQITDLLPSLHTALNKGDNMYVLEGILYLKAWIWAIDEEFHTEIEPYFEPGAIEDYGKELLNKISNHFGYKPTIEDIAFEEVEENKEE